MNSSALRCKAGDLAIIIKSDHESNIGLLVVVREALEPGWWLVRALGEASIMTFSGPSAIAKGPDYALQPIRGDETDLYAERETELVGLV